MMPPTTPKDRLRLLVIGLLLIFCFCLLIVRYYWIQIIDGDKWSKEARKQHYFVVNEPFTRGTFYSNSSIKKNHPEKDQKLVIDIQKFHLFIDPVSIPLTLKKEVVEVLSRLIDVPKEEFNPHFYVKSRSRKIASWLDPEHKSVILEWWNAYAKKHKLPRNALFFVSDYKRSYPFGSLLGQVLHTIQDIKDASTNQALPTGGLELYFNQDLQGKIGKQRLMRSPRNAIETGDVISVPENGKDIYLTINHTLQSIAEEEIEKGVKKWKAKCGWAIMMDPMNGEILALAQYPFFYPGDYQKYFNDPLLIEHTKVKGITDANEVGSIIKPMTVSLALLANQVLEKRGEKPLFDVEEKIPCASGRFPGRSKPITDTHLHHFLNMKMGIQRSSNIYVARLVGRIIERLGPEWYRNALKKVFGFSLKTGIELPSESSGVLPTPGKRHPNGTFEWSTPTPFSMAFGYNLQATSVQLLRASAVLANGGYLVKPTLIRNSKHQKKKVLDPKIVSQVIEAMKYATKWGGTCRRADIFGYSEAGKSSTAKKVVNGIYSGTRFVGGFLGFTPVKNPAFILLVTLDDQNQDGGVCAAPIFKEIARRSLEYLGIPPDDPHGYPKGDPRHDPNKADWVMESRLLNDNYNIWNNN